ncbi:hypothetical protein [Deinococcus hohokamensis]|uniref:Uncharacterized protein n=1 Tax=Deinococcus hohokamensis TaxID=309883 RepID=A0ABV9IAX9_9DEIO
MQEPRPQPNARPSYQPPVVRDLGPWKVVTLEYSVPFNGPTGLGSLLQPGGKPNDF